MQNQSRFSEEFMALERNKTLQGMVNNELMKLGLDCRLKGFKYVSDIITLALIKRKYSRTTIAELTPFIACKYGIKDFSVQRQMRYVCTIRNARKETAIDIVYNVWHKINTKIQEERESYVK